MLMFMSMLKPFNGGRSISMVVESAKFVNFTKSSNWLSVVIGLSFSTYVISVEPSTSNFPRICKLSIAPYILA